jgi:Protein of unknown function (DUF2971)
MASETIVLPPPKTFLRVYHMMEAKWALVAIKNQRLKVSRFENLNDPFELFALNRHTQAARKASKKFAADFNATQGLLCFGADWSNAVMWSHYGDKHKGICLGFDVRRTLLQRIEYKDKRVRAALGSDPAKAILTPALQNQLACIKAKAWEYEEEWRRFVDLASTVPEPPLHFVSFDVEMQLKEVILGDRCLQDLNSVRKLVAAQSPSAVAFKARLAYRSFRVVLNGYTRPSGSPTR